MSRKWCCILALVVAATILFSVSSCGFNQHLISIQVQPSAGATFGAIDPTLFVNFTASGTYEHPPATKDITTQVTWQSDTPQVAQVTTGGVVSPATNCGSANVFATFYDSPNLVTSNEAHVIVDGPASLGCPQSNVTSTLAVTIGGGTGTVTSSPGGITCPSVCIAQFTTGTPVTLTATPANPSTTVSWVGCTPGSDPLVCTVLLETSVSVTATFQ